ncbi:glycosyltransferase [Alloyangia pacifica]|uniref:Glycosyltransferase involved in cell wall bisynthesis n=1 Tax=Alloyangia pacifica TaxID=311180 RepID=A0A1I6QT14_9RHOB|nr:glycosyltransferase [Alloyangia pacifica]SDF97973.1 Glycosyltransferase involved in cell wall bisynthesis [Alloyangia pacifica]SFS55559.1 Glycosyltransferase involved in cell wall bisynthesis [Alloyangia pacifica]
MSVVPAPAPGLPPLRVAQVIGNLEWGGTQELLVYLAERQRIERLALRVFVLSGPVETPYAARLESAGVPVSYLRRGAGGMPGLVRQLAEALRRCGAQLVHAHLRLANTIAPPAGRLCGLPVLGGLHLPPPGPDRRARLRGLLEAQALRRAATGAIACSESVASGNRARLGTLPLVTLPNPAPPPPDLATVEVARADGRAPDAPARFLVVGRLSPEKDVDTVLWAAARLAARAVPFHLSIAGDGESRAALEERARDLALRDQVSFLGPRDDVPGLLCRHDAYVSASRAEGLSIALLEAMSYALPVVATPAGSAFSVVDASVGRRVMPGDPEALATAMAELALDPALRSRLGRAGRARVLRSYRVEDWSAALRRLYRNTIEGDFRASTGRAGECVEDISRAGPC